MHLFSFCQMNCYKAVVIVPVADLVGQQLSSHKGKSENTYNSIPLCCTDTNCQMIFPRIHQLLFNEVVEVLDQDGDQVKIKIFGAFYITSGNTQKHTSFWTLKKNLMALHDLKDFSQATQKIPTPICFQSPNNTDTVITLRIPYKDPNADTVYSAGTRFIKADDDTDQIIVYALNATGSFSQIKIDKSACIENKNLSNNQKIDLFIKILKEWANQSTGFIPYVLGGCSFIHTSTADFYEIKTNFDKKQVSFFALDDFNFIPKDGFDCSNLIVRAAQICSIPYYFKNTLTLSHYLEPLGQDQSIENGDLILVPGHVMIVSDLDKNLLIEARGYPQGYGKVQEIELAKVFKGVTTYTKLKKKYLNKKPLYRTNKAGQIIDTFASFKLLKFSSVFDSQI